MNSWTEAELAYFAGIVDGEGCFCLHGHPKGYIFFAQLQVGNTDPRLMEWMQAHFGGSVRLEKRVKRDLPNSKPIWRWLAHVDNIDALVTALLPFLVIKRDQAELLLAYRRTLSARGGWHGVRPQTPETVKRERRTLRTQISLLNRRGVAS